MTADPTFDPGSDSTLAFPSFYGVEMLEKLSAFLIQFVHTPLYLTVEENKVKTHAPSRTALSNAAMVY